MIDQALLTAADRAWLNDYHAVVRAKVGALLQAQNKPEALAWLEANTQPL